MSYGVLNASLLGEVDECYECGALVIDRERHTEWHEGLGETLSIMADPDTLAAIAEGDDRPGTRAN